MTATDVLLGVDVGTTRVKAVAFDLGGDDVATTWEATPWRHVAGGDDMDAAQLRDVLCRVASSAVPVGARVIGIGVTGFGEAGMLAGPGDEPLTPIPTWYDQRADTGAVRAEIGDDAFHRAVGMRLDAQPSLPKIVRLRTDYAGARAAVRFYSVPEWAVRCLGGRPGSELSLASRTGLLDVVTGEPWAAASDLLGGAQLLGPLVSAGTSAGPAGGEVPAVLHGAALTVAGHDHQSAAFAAGAARDGVLFDSLGTSEALLRFTAEPLTAQVVGDLVAGGLTVGRTVVPGHFCILAGLLTGMGFERVAAALGARDRTSRAALASAALDLSSTSGDGTGPGARAEMVGDDLRLTLTRTVGPSEIWAATVQDLVAASQSAVDRVRAAVGGHGEVVAAGGWFANGAVLDAKRRQFPGLRPSTVAEAGAAGAAYLGGVAAGVLPGPDALSGAPWQRVGAEHIHHNDTRPQTKGT